MGYKPTYGATRTSGIMKTKELASKSSLFNLGKTNPINHVTDFEHSSHEGENTYTKQVPVEPGTNRQSRKGRRQLAKNMAKAANAEFKGYEGTQYNTQGYMRGGKEGSIKLFNNGNILNASTGTRGGGEFGNTGSTDATYKKVKARDIRKQLKETGSASVTNGVISSGTTQTKTVTGSVKRDEIKAAYAAKVEASRNKKANLKARVEGERAREIEERKEARKNKKTNKK